MELGSSLSSSQKPDTCFCPNPHRYTPRALCPICTVSVVILLFISHTRPGTPSRPFFQVSPPNSCTHFYSLSLVPNAPPISFPTQYLVMYKNREAVSHSAVLVSFLLLLPTEGQLSPSGTCSQKPFFSILPLV